MNSLTDIPSTPFAYAGALDEPIEELQYAVQELRSSGRLTPEVLHTLRKYFRVKNIYHSNAIEGNLLTVGETRQVVEYGLTITGRPLKLKFPPITQVVTAPTRCISRCFDGFADLFTLIL